MNNYILFLVFFKLSHCDVLSRLPSHSYVINIFGVLIFIGARNLVKSPCFSRVTRVACRRCIDLTCKHPQIGFLTPLLRVLYLSPSYTADVLFPYATVVSLFRGSQWPKARGLHVYFIVKYYRKLYTHYAILNC